MSRALVKLTPPRGLAELFADPPLVGGETREDYDSLFSAIAAAAKPSDAIAWLFVRDIVDLSWEIRRERSLKRQLIRSTEADLVKEWLTPQRSPSDSLRPDPEFEKDSKRAAKEAELWVTNPKARKKIEKELAEIGLDLSNSLMIALIQVDDQIDAIDRRLASYELRRMAALKTIEQYNETMARRLDTASSNVIDGEFTEAAE